MVFSTFSLHHWSHPTEYLKEIRRVLKDGGEAWIYDGRKDTEKDEDDRIRKKYGRFASFFYLTVVRAHSSLSMKDAEDIISSSGIGFPDKSVIDRGLLLKLKLKKEKI